MADTIALQILKAIETRLLAIRVADGYNTDAGTNVYLGIRTPNPDELDRGPAILVYELQDQPSDDVTICLDTFVLLEIGIEIVSRFEPDMPAEALNRMWQDVARAVFKKSDTTLGGIAQTVSRGAREFRYPEDGGETVAVRQRVEVRYLEPYGDP